MRILTHELYANAGSIPTSISSGQHGHIGMLMSVVDYAILVGANAPSFTMSNTIYTSLFEMVLFLLKLDMACGQFKIQWAPGKTNKAYYFTKHFRHLTMLKSDPHTFI